MRSRRLPHALRLAAVHALAAPLTLSLGLSACGARTGEGADDAATVDAGSVVGVLDSGIRDSAIPDSATHHVDAAPPAPDAACARPPSFGGNCGSVDLSCLPSGLVEGSNSAAQCGDICPAPSGPHGGGPNGTCDISAANGGGYVLSCFCGTGRFPAGLTLDSRRAIEAADPVAAFFAVGAALEASAVRAFEQLAREIAAHGAPRELVQRLRRAARDEVRHARHLRREAKARGASIPRLRAHRAPSHPRALFAIALENAVEGCGREALGGALLHVQALRAEEPRLRALFAEIAEDECAHAQLSADLASWLASQLDETERASIERARLAFFEGCAGDRASADPRVARAVGLPDAATWQRLVRAVSEEMRLAA